MPTWLPAFVFASSAAFVLYVLFGYPLLLGWLCRKYGRPARRFPNLRTVTVVLPVRNGGRWLLEKLHSILELNYPRDLIEVLVISDGSDDRTDEIACQFKGAGVRLLRIPRSGKASAINHALCHATGEIIFFTDVRQKLEPDSLRFMVESFADETVGAVSGELVILDGHSEEEVNVGLYWKYEKWIRRHLSGLDSILGATGCIYAIRRDLAVQLPAGTLLDDVYQPLAAFFNGYRVVLDSRAKAYDYPTALYGEFRRKVRTLAGVLQIIRLCPRVLSPANRMWIHFMSYKLGRLLLPYALLLIAASSFMLPPLARGCAVGSQAGFYALALCDMWLPEGFRLKRISSPIRVFVVLMFAAICAAAILFRSSESLWKVTDVRAPVEDSGAA